VTKTRLIIYISILLLIVSALVVCIFKLAQKAKPTNPKTVEEITPSPIVEITWPEAVNLIQNCQIKIVFQKHSREITLTSKDNSVYKTTEPKIDDVFNETNHLRSDCNDVIQTITE